jgi:amidase
MAVEGPMARTVEDCAMMLRVMAGADKRDPRSLDMGALTTSPTLTDTPENLRLAWAPNPAGLPIEPAVSSVLEAALLDMQHLYPAIEEIDLSELKGAMEIFNVLRAAAFAEGLGYLYHSHQEKMKATVIDNIKLGLELTSDSLAQAEAQRASLYRGMTSLFDRFDYLLLPVTQVMPFQVELEYPTTINKEVMNSYIEWMSSCCILSPFDVPCLSIPAGFNTDGLPVGLQIVGRPGDDWGVLRLAYAFQQHTGHWQQPPPHTGEVPHGST